MKFIRSFGHAWRGIQHAFTTQLNFRIHILILLLVLIAGFVLKISSIEWLFVIGCSMLVLSLELINTAIEHMCDSVTKKIHPAIRIIKDASAAAVLLGAIGSVVTGLIIFLPRIIHLVK
ncbi:MAG: diacylglycerol kinase [Ferruginibacter sp.]|nr:diacylglycerol kinase [Ferruginibacter sp.]